MGFLKKYREEQAAAHKAQAEAALHAAIVSLIPIAEGGTDQTQSSSLVLHPGERLVYTIINGGLFEPRRGQGHWSGRSAGVSVPVIDGVRFRVGKSAGTYIQGAEEPTVIDQGDISFTTQRVAFQGAKYTREWDYSKLVGVVHDAHKPWTAIQVSNREKTSGFVYPGLAPEAVRLRLAVAIAIFNGEGAEVAKELHEELASRGGGPIAAEFDLAAPPASATEPTPPQPSAPDEVSRPQPPVAAAPSPPPPKNLPPPPQPMWTHDPSGRHQYRWFDGKTWTDFVADNGQESHDPL
jgi:hypothetical protein